MAFLFPAAAYLSPEQAVERFAAVCDRAATPWTATSGVARPTAAARAGGTPHRRATPIPADAVLVLGSPPPAPGTIVGTRDFVRPQWMSGKLTIVTAPATNGRIAPFEVPNPTPCCANHG